MQGTLTKTSTTSLLSYTSNLILGFTSCCFPQVASLVLAIYLMTSTLLTLHKLRTVNWVYMHDHHHSELQITGCIQTNSICIRHPTSLRSTVYRAIWVITFPLLCIRTRRWAQSKQMLLHSLPPSSGLIWPLADGPLIFAIVAMILQIVSTREELFSWI